MIKSFSSLLFISLFFYAVQTGNFSFQISAAEKQNKSSSNDQLCTDTIQNNFVFDRGGIIRTDTTKKFVHLIFSGHEFADGAETIIQTLDQHQVKACFFFTGDFIRKYPDLVKRLKSKQHYIGPHSDKHLLYNDWIKRDSLLVTKEQFLKDLQDNYIALESIGIKKEESNIFLPPYEWYNDSISVWAQQIGVQIINFTPGTTSNADYTIPSMGKQYRSSEEIYRNILNFEEKETLNGTILLLHIGAHPERTDKFYYLLNDLIIELKSRNYQFQLIKL